jgi:hypothetical protein
MERWFADLGRALAAARPEGASGGGLRFGALGWATVDHERTIEALADLTFDPAAGDELLGAYAWRARVGHLDLLVLEPSTEGRLTGALARWGEGLAVLYLEGAGGGPTEAPGRRAMTPLGRGGHVVDGPREGPFVVLLDDAPQRPGSSGSL